MYISCMYDDVCILCRATCTYHACMMTCAELAQSVVDSGSVPLLVLAVQEPEVDLKRIAASALSDICKHSPEVRVQLIPEL